MDNNHLNKIKEIAKWGNQNGKSEQEIMSAVLKYKQQNAPETMRGEGSPDRSPYGISATVRDIPGDMKEAWRGVKGQFQRGVDKQKEARQQVTEGQISPMAGTIKTIGAGIGAGAGVVGEASMGALKTFIPPKIEEVVGDTVKKGMQAVIDRPEVQKAVEYYYSLPPEQKAWAEGTLGLIEGVGTVFSAGATGQLTGNLKDAAIRGIKTRYDNLIKTVDGTPTERNRSAWGAVFPLLRQTDPNLQKAASEYSKDISASFVNGNTNISNKLDEISRIKNTTREKLLEDWSSKGYVPTVDRGGLANFNGERAYIKQQKQDIWEKEISPKVKAVQDEFDADILADFLKEGVGGAYKTEGITGVRGADFDASIKEVDKIIQNYKNKYDTDTFNAEQLREIQTDMNKVSNAFNREGWQADTEEVVAQTIRRVFDDLDPSISEANRKYGQLLQDEKLIDIFDNQKIHTNSLAEAAGRYSGAVGASFIGVGVATGAGSIVIMGLAAQLGGKFVNQWLRKKRFNPEVRKRLRLELNANPSMKESIKDSMTPSERKEFESLLGSEDGKK